MIADYPDTAPGILELKEAADMCGSLTKGYYKLNNCFSRHFI